MKSSTQVEICRKKSEITANLQLKERLTLQRAVHDTGGMASLLLLFGKVPWLLCLLSLIFVLDISQLAFFILSSGVFQRTANAGDFTQHVFESLLTIATYSLLLIRILCIFFNIHIDGWSSTERDLEHPFRPVICAYYLQTMLTVHLKPWSLFQWENPCLNIGVSWANLSLFGKKLFATCNHLAWMIW